MKYLENCLIILVTFLGLKKGFAYECEPNWHLFQKKCFNVVYSTATEPAIEQRCFQMGADLVSFHSLEESQFIAKLIQGNNFWLGGKRNTTNKNDFWWIDGSEWNYSRWASGQPVCSNNYDCVYTNKGYMYAYPCGNNMYQLCQKAAKPQRRFTVELDMDDTMNKMNAIANSVNTAEQKYNESVAELNSSFITALKPVNEVLKTQDARLSQLEKQINESAEHEVEQTSSKDETVKQVYRVEEKFKKLTQASEMISNILTIDNEAIEVNRRRSEKLIEMNENTKSAEVSSQRCFKTNQFTNCYYFVKTSITFTEAKKYCKTLNANIASISTEEENSFLRGYMIFNEDYWIGGLRLTPYSNNFAWVDGAVFNYTNFADSVSETFTDKQQGNKSNFQNQKKVHNCLSVKHGIWFHTNCNKKLSLICKAADAGNNQKNDGNTIIDAHTSELFEFEARMTNLEKSIAFIVNALRNDTRKN